MRIFARHSLVDQRHAHEPALLLEGSWPRPSSAHGALDDLIDARHGWIDREASRLAHTAAVGSSTAYLNERKLRYYFVKLLRVIAWFAAKQPLPGQFELVVARGRDEDYVALFETLCAKRFVRLNVQWREEPRPRQSMFPANPIWRRLAGGISEWTQRRWPGDGQPRVVLCGSRRVLDPVCGELLARSAHVAWLYDRFAAKTWLRWRAAGVVQWVCDSSELLAGTSPSLGEGRGVGGVITPFAKAQGRATPKSTFDVALAEAAGRFLLRVQQQLGPRQQRLASRVDGYFLQHRPTLLVLDEDATPMARAAVAAARRHGVPSAVVQHGVPRVRFGFAPLAADAICVWGESSRRQLLRWGVPPKRIRVTGWPGGREAHIEHRTSSVEHRTLGLLLFATTTPADDRPDAVSFHLTTKTYRRMLRMAFAAAVKVPGARLTIKLHPRDRHGSLVHGIGREFPELHYRIVTSGGLFGLLQHTDCVLNCTSSAGIEAARCGVPVIELIPSGSDDLLPAAEWGTFGTARTDEELEVLLRQALAVGRGGKNKMDYVFASLGQQAARKTVDALLLSRSAVSADTSPPETGSAETADLQGAA